MYKGKMESRNGTYDQRIAPVAQPQRPGRLLLCCRLPGCMCQRRAGIGQTRRHKDRFCVNGVSSSWNLRGSNCFRGAYKGQLLAVDALWRHGSTQELFPAVPLEVGRAALVVSVPVTVSVVSLKVPVASRAVVVSPRMVVVGSRTVVVGSRAVVVSSAALEASCAFTARTNAATMAKILT